MEKTLYILVDENSEFIGIVQTPEVGKALAREYFSSTYGNRGEFVATHKPADGFKIYPHWEFEYFDSDLPFSPVLYLDEVPYFAKGTMFPVDTGLSETIEIPAYLRRQAD